MSAPTRDQKNFADMAEQETPGLLREFVRFLGERKKWWLAPIVAMLLLLGVLILLGGTGAAPFIYTLF
jgi:hypothetical protein